MFGKPRIKCLITLTLTNCSTSSSFGIMESSNTLSLQDIYGGKEEGRTGSIKKKKWKTNWARRKKASSIEFLFNILTYCSIQGVRHKNRRNISQDILYWSEIFILIYRIKRFHMTKTTTASTAALDSICPICIRLHWLH